MEPADVAKRIMEDQGHSIACKVGLKEETFIEHVRLELESSGVEIDDSLLKNKILEYSKEEEIQKELELNKMLKEFILKARRFSLIVMLLSIPLVFVLDDFISSLGIVFFITSLLIIPSSELIKKDLQKKIDYRKGVE